MTNQNVQTNKHGPQTKGYNQASADNKHYLVSQLRPTMPIGLKEGNIGRSVYPGFGKSIYGASLAKHIRNNFGNCHIFVDQISDSCDSYDLTHSIKKTEVVYQPAPGKPYKEPTNTVIGQRLQVVDKFTYLGSTLSRVVHIDDKVNTRIAKASAAFGRLRGSVWDRSGIMFDTKTENLQSCGAANTIVCMRNVDSLPTARQKTEPLQYKLP